MPKAWGRFRKLDGNFFKAWCGRGEQATAPPMPIFGPDGRPSILLFGAAEDLCKPPRTH